MVSFPVKLEAEDLICKLTDCLGWGIAESCTGLFHRTDHRRGATEEDLHIWRWGRAECLHASN